MVHRRSGIAATLVFAGALLVLSGCDLGVPTYGCADWVSFDSPQEMYDEATLVVEGTVGVAGGQATFDTGPGVEHEIAVDRVHKGDLSESTLVAASPRDYCTENAPQPSDDPLQEGDRVILF